MLKRYLTPLEDLFIIIFPEPTEQSGVPGVSPGRGLLIPLAYLHLGKCEHSEVESHPPRHGRWSLKVFVVMRMRERRVITGFKNMADYHEERKGL